MSTRTNSSIPILRWRSTGPSFSWKRRAKRPRPFTGRPAGTNGFPGLPAGGTPSTAFPRDVTDPVNLAAESRIRTFCRETGLLIDARGRPLGGKWSFDPQNRRRLPKEIPVPRPWREAKPGDPLRFPTTREEAEKARPREFAGGFRSAGLRLAGTAAAGGPNGCPGQRRASENFMIRHNNDVNKDLAKHLSGREPNGIIHYANMSPISRFPTNTKGGRP